MKLLLQGGQLAAQPAINMVIAATLILCLLAIEGAVLSMHGHWNVLVPLLAVLVASAVSIVIGFAFPALAGAVLFHVIDDPILRRDRLAGTSCNSGGRHQPFILGMQRVSLVGIQLTQLSSPAMARTDWQTLSDRQFELAVTLFLVLSGISLAFLRSMS
jgi:hypothetical protein